MIRLAQLEGSENYLTQFIDMGENPGTEWLSNLLSNTVKRNTWRKDKEKACMKCTDLNERQRK